MKKINEIKEKYAELKSHFPKVKAKVILCRCSVKTEGKNLFGIRIEERNKIWYRTWAFKIDEEKAKHEGWNSERIISSLNFISEYNGCPYCGGFSVSLCSCGKIFCYEDNGKDFSNGKKVKMKCPWCEQVNVYQQTEAIEVQGGGM